MFPLLATIIGALMGVVVWYQYATRHKPYQLAWAISFTLFAAASGAEWIAETWGWTPLLARSYYLFGATLVTGFLALGMVWLLWPGQAARTVTWVIAALAVIAAVALWQAPVAVEALEELGWEAMERPPLVRAISMLFNIGGTLLLVIGTLSSWLSIRRRPELRYRANGILILTIGVIVVASGGSLAGVLSLAERDLLAITNSIGSAIMLTGILIADKRPAQSTKSSSPNR